VFLSNSSSDAPDLNQFRPSDTLFLIWDNVDISNNALRHWFFSDALPAWISWLMVFSAGASVLMLIIGGGMILLSGINEDLRSRGTKTIIWSIAGIILMLLAMIIVQIVNNLPFSRGTGTLPSYFPNQSGSDLPVSLLSSELIPDIIKIILNITYAITVGMILYAGALYVIRNDDEEYETKAKNIFRNGIIGLIIISVSYAVVYGVTQLLFNK
jgi:hypothetical protein